MAPLDALSFDDLIPAGKPGLSFDDLIPKTKPDYTGWDTAPPIPVVGLPPQRTPLLADEPGYQYGSVLPFRKNLATGEIEPAVPEAIRAPVRGLQLDPFRFDPGDPQQVADLGAAASVVGARPSVGEFASVPPRPLTGEVQPPGRRQPPGPTPPRQGPTIDAEVVGTAPGALSFEDLVPESRRIAGPARALPAPESAPEAPPNVNTAEQNGPGKADVAASGRAGAGGSPEPPVGETASTEAQPTEPTAAESDDKYIVAYHGTPHEFEQFDTSKIGTGEGAQAYGHGLYFAENPGVGEGYRKQLSGPGGSANLAAKRAALEAADLPAALKADVKTWNDLPADGENAATIAYNRNREARDYITANRGHVEAMLQKVIDAQNNKGHLLTVRINAEPEEMLDWDKPINEQPPLVQAALKRMDRIGTAPEAQTELGGDWYRGNAGDEESSASLSAEMRAAGIKGIRYLDQGSRNAGDWTITPPSQTVAGDWMVKSSDYNSKGLHFKTEAEARAALAEKQAQATHNIVIFDHNDVDITHRNGKEQKPKKLTPVDAYRIRKTSMLGRASPTAVA